jgi:hypothetical protein
MVVHVLVGWVVDAVCLKMLVHAVWFLAKEAFCQCTWVYNPTHFVSSFLCSLMLAFWWFSKSC